MVMYHHRIIVHTLVQAILILRHIHLQAEVTPLLLMVVLLTILLHMARLPTQLPLMVLLHMAPQLMKHRLLMALQAMAHPEPMPPQAVWEESPPKEAYLI